MFEVAGLPVAQVALDVTAHETMSPSFNEAVLYVIVVTPTGAPLTIHWYAGVVPPFVATAVKVILVPGQTVPEGLDEMVTLTGADGLTLIERVFDVAGEPEAQAELEVKMQDTASPLTKLPEV